MIGVWIAPLDCGDKRISSLRSGRMVSRPDKDRVFDDQLTLPFARWYAITEQGLRQRLGGQIAIAQVPTSSMPGSIRLNIAKPYTF